MTTHCFTLTLVGEDTLTPEISDRLHEAGINGDDTLVGSREGSVFVEFEREAETRGEAVRSAIDQVERAGYLVSVVRFNDIPVGR